MDKALKILKGLSKKLKIDRCVKFSKSLLDYINDYWINGSIDVKIWNMYEFRGQRTNNLAEGYNFKLGAKSSISKHPNPYLLTAIIKDELNIAKDNALVLVMGKTNRRKNTKYETLRKYQDNMMDMYSKDNIELYVYMQSMGGYHITKDARTRTDLDPEPYNDGIPSKSYENNVSIQDEDETFESDTDIADDVVTINNNLLKTVKPSDVPEQVSKKKTKKVMHRRQAPVPGVRESICNIASTQIEHTVENETNNNNSLLLALTAVSAAAVVASSSS